MILNLLAVNDSDPLFILWVILIVIAVFAVFFVLAAVILWQILKAVEKEVYKEFDKFIPLEQERAKVTAEALNMIEERHLKMPEGLTEKLKKALEDLKEADTPDTLRPVKDILDWSDLIMAKVLRERGRKPECKAMAERLENSRKGNDQDYQAFARVAGSYNAILSMWPTRLANRCHRRANRRTKIGLF